MMLYMITGHDAPDSREPRRSAHAAHMARITIQPFRQVLPKP